MVVLLDPTSDAGPGFLQGAILGRPDILIPSSCDGTRRCSFCPPGDVLRRSPMGDAEPRECFQEARASELCVVVRSERPARFTPALGQRFQDRLLYRCERSFGPGTVREIPAHDLSRAAVYLTDEASPTHC